MKTPTGTVVQGKVVPDGVSLPEGTVVTVIAQEPQTQVVLPDALQHELEEALDAADREEGISGDEMIEKLREYG